METAPTISFACMMVVTAVAAIWDSKTGKIPNRLTAPTFCAGLLFQAAYGFWQSGLPGAGNAVVFALGGFATGFVVLTALWIVNGAGGGDAKLMGAVGTWLGASFTFHVLLLSAVFAVVCTVVVLVRNRLRRAAAAESPDEGKKNVWSALARPFQHGPGWSVSFGLPAALGTWTVAILYWAGYRVPLL